MAFLKKINFGNGSHDIAKTIVKGKPEGVISVSNTSGFENTDSEENNYSYDIDVNVDNATIVKSSGSLAVGTVPAANVSVADSAGVFTAENVETALKELKDDIAEVGGAAKSYTIIEKTTDLPTNVAHRYKLQQTIGEGATARVTEVGENIDILKDNSLLAAKLSTTDATWDAVNKVIVDGTGKQALVLVYQDADGAAQVIHIDVSKFLSESEFKDGLQVNNSGEVSAKLGQGLEFGGESGENQSIKVKVDSTSENFLTVGANGVKLAGVQNAIDTKVATLDLTTDAAVEGQYVAAIEETDGVVAVKTRANVSDAVLTGYAKGSDETAVAATDTINKAFSKIEVRIDNNENTTAAALNDLNDKIDGVDTDLTAEETRAKAAESEIAGKVGLTGTEGSLVFTPTTNYGGAGTQSAATSVMDNMQKIDTALKAVSDKADAIQYKVSGTTLEFFGISSKTV